MNNLFKVTVSVLTWSLCSLGAHAQSISLQFLQYPTSTNGLAASTVAGVDPVDNWNVNSSTVSNAALQDNTSALTSATFSVQAGRYFTGNNFPAGGDNELLSGGLNSYAGTTASTLTFNSIPYAAYDVYVYGVSDNPSNDTASQGYTTTFGLTPAGAATQYLSLQPVTDSSSYIQSTSTFDGIGAPPTTGFTQGANYVEFTGLTASDFSLVFSGVDPSGGSFNSSLNGLQIVDIAATPEPSTYLLFGAGFLVLMVFRKRLARW
jgi:hypothetical protein